MKRNITEAIIAAALCGIVVTGCTPAIAEQTDRDAFRDVSDTISSQQIEAREAAKREFAMKRWNEAQEAARAAQEAAEAAAAVEAAMKYQEEYYEPYSGSYTGYRGNPDGLNNYDGTYEHDGRVETFYSGDNAIYRDQLWVDDDGFYRTEEGYYAVAASDKAPGDTFEGSQGTCYVIDGGNEPGNTDYCVSGWY
ncbi:MAG: hypothetical protein IJ111_01440 [Eggerthellaceae bacterium]|nr:hypothetical protein [Eggerthellaceae bacterium]